MNTSLLKTIAHHELGLHLVNQIISNVGLLGNLFLGTQNPHIVYKHWNQVNQVLGMIRRNITYKEKSLIIPLYKAIVRPHLEYCIQAWNPHLRKDVDMLEKIQRRATKLIPELRDLT